MTYDSWKLETPPRLENEMTCTQCGAELEPKNVSDPFDRLCVECQDSFLDAQAEDEEDTPLVAGIPCCAFCGSEDLVDAQKLADEPCCKKCAAEFAAYINDPRR